jgi:hypothetical protein
VVSLCLSCFLRVQISLTLISTGIANVLKALNLVAFCAWFGLKMLRNIPTTFRNLIIFF